MFRWVKRTGPNGDPARPSGPPESRVSSGVAVAEPTPRCVKHGGFGAQMSHVGSSPGLQLGNHFHSWASEDELEAEAPITRAGCP